MAQPHETGSSPYIATPDTTRKIIDPLSFVPLDIRRKIGYEWPDQVHSILYGSKRLSDTDPSLGIPAERLGFFEQPKHENSDSHYIFEGFLGKGEVKDWVGVYVLLPNERTSEHGHPPGLREEYRILKGEMILFEDGKARVIDGVDKFTIEPGNRHHSRTEDDQFALVMVVMIDANQHEQLHLDSIRPKVSPKDPSPRKDAIGNLIDLYREIYDGAIYEPETLLRWIKTMPYREIIRTIEVGQRNPEELRQNPRYSWVVGA